MKVVSVVLVVLVGTASIVVVERAVATTKSVKGVVGVAMTKVMGLNAGPVGSTKFRIYVPVAILLRVNEGHIKLSKVVAPELACVVTAVIKPP